MYTQLSRIWTFQPPSSHWHHKPPRGSTVTIEITQRLPITCVLIPPESSTFREHYAQAKTEYHHIMWSLIWERFEDVKTLASKHLWRSRVANERGGQGGGGASAQPPTTFYGVPRGSKGSNNKTSQETSDPDSMPDSHGNEKKKQTPSNLQSHPSPRKLFLHMQILSLSPSISTDSQKRNGNIFRVCVS